MCENELIKNEDDEYFIDSEIIDDENIEEEVSDIYKNPFSDQLNSQIESFNSDEAELILKKINNVSNLIINQSYDSVSFDRYKGNLEKFFDEITTIYQLINNWQAENIFEIADLFNNSKLNDLLRDLSYMPNNSFLGNIITVLCTCIEVKSFESRSVMETEILFQGLKKIYDERIINFVLPFLAYTYLMDKSLLAFKKFIWQAYNKNGDLTVSFFLMDNIQKSLIRMKKAKEFLDQENFDTLPEKYLNTKLLKLITEKNSLSRNIYNTFEENNIITTENKVSIIKSFKIKKNLFKTLSQELISYKLREVDSDFSNILESNLNNDNIETFFAEIYLPFLENYLNDNLSSSEEFEVILFSKIIRKVIFNTMFFVKQNNINIEISLTYLFITLLKIVQNNVDDLKYFSYIITKEILCGCLKIKYKVEQVITVLALIIEHLPKNNNLNSNFKIINEYIYNGFFDTLLEMYPNLMTVNKYIKLLFDALEKQILKNKIDKNLKMKTLLESNKLKKEN